MVGPESQYPEPSEPAVKNPDVVGAEQLVSLDQDHPGFRDADYRARRNAIARVAMDYRKGDPVPDVVYTEDEHDVWQQVWGHLAPMHDRYACRAYHLCSEALKLDRERIPQLSEVNPALERESGFRMMPVAGLVQPGVFLAHLGEGYFLSTQYMRHHTRPLYTPEPDIIHELVGHAVALANPGIAEINRRFGAALDRGADVARLSRVYWYTIEYGVVFEDGEPRAYGAGLLSSFGELGHFVANTPLLPFDLERIANTPFDPTQYQPHLFAAPSLDTALQGLRSYLDAL